MAKIKLTKNEQKKQKDSLKQFSRYLPTLQLKKQQLQVVIRQSEKEIEEIRREQKEHVASIDSWIAVYGGNTEFDSSRSIGDLISIREINITKGNVAGVVVPVFNSLEFNEIIYDLREYPLWVDTALTTLRDVAKYDAIIAVLEERIRVLNKELRTTTQRVNLFEKVKIPEAKENIRVIGIYLQDQQTSAVVRGKIAKKKMVRVS